MTGMQAERMISMLKKIESSLGDIAEAIDNLSPEPITIPETHPIRCGLCGQWIQVGDIEAHHIDTHREPT